MLMKAIFWKEWRQQSPFLFAIVLFLPIVMGLLGWLGGSFADDRFLTSDRLGMAALGVAILQAMVTGSLLFAGEIEGGTLDFLDACSAERSRIWLAKMASAFVIALPALLLPALVGGVQGLPWTAFAIETLLLAAVCSVFVRTTFRAIGAAALSLFLVSCGRSATSRPFRALGMYGLNLLIVGVAVFAAWLRFCRLDRDRHADGPHTHASAACRRTGSAGSRCGCWSADNGGLSFGQRRPGCVLRLMCDPAALRGRWLSRRIRQRYPGDRGCAGGSVRVRLRAFGWKQRFCGSSKPACRAVSWEISSCLPAEPVTVARQGRRLARCNGSCDRRRRCP